MARRDDLHFPVRRALEKDGWAITDDPFVLYLRDTRLKADLAAERYFAAENGGRKIAVEVKDFDGHSLANELQKTIGQLQLYQWRSTNKSPTANSFSPSARRCMINTFVIRNRCSQPWSNESQSSSSFLMRNRR